MSTNKKTKVRRVFTLLGSGFFPPPCSNITQDQFCRKVTRIYEEVNEQNVEDLYEFMTEQDMKDHDPPFSENLTAVEYFFHGSVQEVFTKYCTW